MTVRLMHVVNQSRSWQFFGGQIRYLTNHGYEVHLVSGPGPERDTLVANEGGVAHEFSMVRTISPLQDLRSLWQVFRTYRHVRPHIVEAHTSKVASVAIPAAWLARVPVRIYHNHGIASLSSSGLERFILRAVDRMVALLSTRVVYVAPSVRDAGLAEHLVTAAKSLSVLSINGLDTHERFNPASFSDADRTLIRYRFGIPEGARVIGFVGRIFKVKGVHDLVQAWRTLSGEIPDVHLLVCGEFDDRDPVPGDVEVTLRTDPRIHLTGFIDPAPAYAVMDVLATPSYHEGLGYVVIEAGAMGVPVIATRIPGIIDALENGVGGTLIEVSDVPALTDGLRQYLADPDLRMRHGIAARARITQLFDQERTWTAYDNLYKRLLTEADIHP